MTDNQINTLMIAARQEAERTAGGTTTGGEGSNSITTTDATPTNVLTITPELGTVGILEVRVWGNSGEDIIAGIKAVRFKRITTTGIGTVYDIMAVNNDAGLSGATFSIVASAPDILVQVTGLAATTINWSATYNIDSSLTGI